MMRSTLRLDIGLSFVLRLLLRFDESGRATRLAPADVGQRVGRRPSARRRAIGSHPAPASVENSSRAAAIAFHADESPGATAARRVGGCIDEHEASVQRPPDADYWRRPPSRRSGAISARGVLARARLAVDGAAVHGVADVIMDPADGTRGLPHRRRPRGRACDRVCPRRWVSTCAVAPSSMVASFWSAGRPAGRVRRDCRRP